MRGKKNMRKRYWRDVIWFGLGTFFGGFVLNLITGLFRRVGG